MAKELDIPSAAAQILALVDRAGSLTPLGSGSHADLPLPAELAGKVLWELVHPDDIAAVHSTVSEVLATGAPRAIRFRIPGDASRWRTLAGTVEPCEGDAPCQATVTATVVDDADATESRASEDGEQLRRADKLEVLGRLAGGIFMISATCSRSSSTTSSACSTRCPPDPARAFPPNPCEAPPSGRREWFGTCSPSAARTRLRPPCSI